MVFGSLVKKQDKKSKTARNRNTKKGKKNATSVAETTVEENGGRVGKTQQKGGKGAVTKKRDNRGSKEQPQSTAMAQSTRQNKKNKNSKKKKNKEGGSKDFSEDAAETPNPLNHVATQMLNASTNPAGPESPATVPPGAPTTVAEDDNTNTMKMPLVTPPAVDPCMQEASSLKPKIAAPHDKSIKAVAANSALTPNSTVSQADKWAAEDTAKAWLDKVSYEKTKQEFDKIQTMTVNVANECKKWKANGKLNQSADDYPALDSNLATVENVYVNISKIELPTLRSMFIGQIPVKGNEESFWKVIFDKRITSMQIIALPGEPIDFFPTPAGLHVYHGTMFVNNRRVETVNEDVHRFAIEVLPDGCSNSIICNITIIKNWNIDSVHAKQAIVIKECIDLINFLVSQSKDDNAIVVSKHGAGRAGYLVALAVAIQSMDKKTEPSIYDIVKGIRAQRPKAVESVTQYASIYTSMFYYIKKKIARTDGGSVDKKTIAESNDPICKKSRDLTTLFANALIAEVNAGGGRSTMTMLK